MVPSISFVLLTSVAQSSHYLRPRSVLVGERDSEERESERKRMNGVRLMCHISRAAKRGTDDDDVDVKLQEREVEISNAFSKSNIHLEPAKKKKKKKKKKKAARGWEVFSCDTPGELHG
ncbi:unnamed protein product [Musa textilis]